MSFMDGPLCGEFNLQICKGGKKLKKISHFFHVIEQKVSNFVVFSKYLNFIVLPANNYFGKIPISL